MTNELSLAELIKNPELRPKNEDLEEQAEKLDPPTSSVELKEIGSINVPRVTLHEWLVKNKSVLAKQDVKVVEIEISGVPKEENIGIAFPTGQELGDGTQRRKFVVLNEVDQFFVADLPIEKAKFFNKGMSFEVKVRDDLGLTSYITPTSYTMSARILTNNLFVPYFVTKVNRKSNDPLVVPQISTSTINVKLQELANFDLLMYYYPQISAISEKGDSWLHYVRYLIKLKERITSVPHLIQIDETIAKTVGLNEG